MMPLVRIFTLGTCVHCQALKDMLEQHALQGLERRGDFPCPSAGMATAGKMLSADRRQ